MSCEHEYEYIGTTAQAHKVYSHYYCKKCLDQQAKKWPGTVGSSAYKLSAREDNRG